MEVNIPYKEMFEHSTILGAPGAGKSASLFIPNLFRQAERLAAGYKIPNIVVTDPKGELLRLTGPYFRDAGARLWVFHPLDPQVSLSVNVIRYANTWEVADRVAQTIVKNTGTSKVEPFFENNAKLLLAMLILHCRVSCPDASLSHVHALATMSSAQDMQQILEKSSDDMVRGQARGFFSRVAQNERLLGSVMSELPHRLNLWNLSTIREVTTANEIDFYNFYQNNKENDKPTIMYVINPLERKAQLAPLMATFFTEFFLATVEVAKRQPDGKLPRPVWFLLDEFANIGYVPGFNEFLTTCRGFACGLILGIQSRSQLYDLYGEEGGETIINSCANFMCYPRIGPEDAKWVSRLLGDTTVQDYAKTYQYGDILAQHRKSETKRPLLSPDEIRALPPDRLIVIAGTRRPVLIKQMRWYLQDRWKGRQMVEWSEFGREEALTAPDPEELIRDVLPPATEDSLEDGDTSDDASIVKTTL